MRREVTPAMVSTSTRSLAFRVEPVETRSTMRRHRPRPGASSMAPFSLMHSACTPRAAKCRRVMPGYLVATRMWLQRLGSSLSAKRRGAATARRQADLEIDRGVELRIVELHQHVVAGNPQMGGAEGDERDRKGTRLNYSH